MKEQISIRQARQETPSAWVDEFLEQECTHGPFLTALIEPLKKMYEHLPETKASRDEIILRVQSLGHLHYQTLWASCSRREQYVLYDLAQDGLVNSKNIQVIRGLIDKGLLLYDGTIWLMNRSFRNFILVSVKREDALLLERAAMENGAWQELKTPLLLVVLSLVGFVFFTQKEAFGQISAVLTAMATLLPLLPRILGVFAGLGDKSAPKE